MNRRRFAGAVLLILAALLLLPIGCSTLFDAPAMEGTTCEGILGLSLPSFVPSLVFIGLLAWGVMMIFSRSGRN
jgi:hypothetical protein